MELKSVNKFGLILLGLFFILMSLGLPTLEAAPNDIVIVSSTAGGTEANGDSRASHMSAGGRYVAFQSEGSNLDGAATGGMMIFRKDLSTNDVILVSSSAAGVEAEADCYHPNISADGRYVVFHSYASNLVIAADGTDQHIFRKDLHTGAVVLVSTDASGTIADDDCERPKMTPDGRYVCFGSEATNLVTAADGTYKQTFRKDMDTGKIKLVSSSKAGVEADDNTGHASISDDGVYVAFHSPASNLHANASGSDTNVFRKNVNTGTIDLVSSDSAGVEGDAKSKYCSISSDGRYVSFNSEAANLDPAAVGGFRQAYLKDLNTGTVTMVSCNAAGIEGDVSVEEYGPYPVSDDGRFVAFLSSATNLNGAASGANTQVLRKDLVTGEVLLASSTNGGVESDNWCWKVEMTDDARFVSFYSPCSNLTGASTGTYDEVYCKEFGDYSGASTPIMLVSADKDGVEGDDDSGGSDIATKYVVFRSSATDLLSSATSGTQQIFRKNVLTGAIDLVSKGSSGEADDDCYHPDISPNGKYVTFSSSATNLVAAATGANEQVFRKNMENGSITLVSCTAAGVEADSTSRRAEMSDDGSLVVFWSDATNLGGSGANFLIYVKDMSTDAVTLVSSDAFGVEANANCGHPTLSGDGIYAMFHSWADNLLAAADGTNVQVFRKTISTGAIELVSCTAGGVAGDGESNYPAASYDGRYISFGSWAANLNAASGTYRQAMVKDMTSGTVYLASANEAGTEADDGSANNYEPIPMSADGRFVGFANYATNLHPMADGSIYHMFRKDIISGKVDLVSCSTVGSPSDADIWSPAISPDGRYATFQADATNLDPAATGADDQVFCKEFTVYSDAAISSGSITVVSTNAYDEVGDDDSYANIVSGNGKFVAFQSWAENLHPAAELGNAQILIKNLATGAVELASCNAAGFEANSDCYVPEMSADGRYVVFHSDADNLVAAATGSEYQVFRKDMETGEIVLVSCGIGGEEGDAENRRPAVSDNGRYVMFESWSTNIHPANDGDYRQIIRKDLETGEVELASSNSAGFAANSETGHPAMSADGNYISFHSSADNLHLDADGSEHQVFRKNMSTGVVDLVSCNASGAVADDKSRYSYISSNGRYIAFRSEATNLTPGATSGQELIYMKDLDTGELLLVSCNADGIEGDDDADSYGLLPVSDNGRYVTFTSDATNYLTEADGTNLQVFRKDLQTGAIELVSRDSSGAAANDDCYRPCMSRDGLYVTFYSDASNLDPVADGSDYQVFIRAMGASTTTTKKKSSGGGGGGGCGFTPDATSGMFLIIMVLGLVSLFYVRKND